MPESSRSSRGPAARARTTWAALLSLALLASCGGGGGSGGPKIPPTTVDWTDLGLTTMYNMWSGTVTTDQPIPASGGIVDIQYTDDAGVVLTSGAYYIHATADGTEVVYLGGMAPDRHNVKIRLTLRSESGGEATFSSPLYYLNVI